MRIDDMSGGWTSGGWTTGVAERSRTQERLDDER